MLRLTGGIAALLPRSPEDFMIEVPQAFDGILLKIIIKSTLTKSRFVEVLYKVDD